MASPRLTEPVLQRGEIRDQVQRILASPVFRNSRRNSSLLRHVVERTLEGRPEELKERSIGVDVFGKAADYDTNTDHVVRSVAGEVRRRLAQYYMEPGRESELRIDLQAGSYVPHFHFPAERPVLAPVETMALPPEPASGHAPGYAPQRRMRLILAAALLTVALASVLVFRLTTRLTAVEAFWNPLFSSPNPAMLCFGGGGGPANPASEANLALSIGEFDRQPFRRMHTSDAMALADLAGLLQANRKPFRIVNRASATSFRDLQSGPFVLVGAMNNEWTLRLTSGLRFSFERQPNGARIVDKQNPSTGWSVDFTQPVAQLKRDYAIVSRVRDPQTEQTMVIVAGIGSWGTLAAGEFVTMPEHLKKLERLAPANWEQKNLQVVLATDVIRGSSGPPTVLAAHFW